MRNFLVQALIGLILGLGGGIAYLAWTEGTPGSAAVVAGIAVVAALTVSLWLRPRERRSRGFEPQRRRRG